MSAFYVLVFCYSTSLFPIFHTTEFCFCRASIELNFQEMYLKFLEKVNLKALNKEIVQATYENCKVCSWITYLIVFVLLLRIMYGI